MNTEELIKILEENPGEIEVWCKNKGEIYRSGLNLDMLHYCYSSNVGNKIKIMLNMDA